MTPPDPTWPARPVRYTAQTHGLAVDLAPAAEQHQMVQRGWFYDEITKMMLTVQAGAIA